MYPAFWTNTIWYILLGMSTLIELVILMIISKKRMLNFAFYITILGIVLTFETMILIFLKAYAYYPMIFIDHSNPFDDVLAGNLFSQFSVSATAILIVVLNLKNYWCLIVALIYGIVEELFLSLGVYKHNWYQTWMTVVMMTLACRIAKKMYERVLQGMSRVLYYVYIFFGLFSLYVITILWGLQVSGLMSFSTTALNDPISSRYFIALTVFFIPPSLVMMVVYFSRLAWFWKALIIGALYAIYYTCYRLNLFWIKEGLFLLLVTVLNLWMYMSVYVQDRLYGKPVIEYK